MKIFIYGVPGSGKTTYSRYLEEETGHPVFEADIIRARIKEEKTKEQDPFMYLGTTESFRIFGELTEENAIKGLKAVRQSLMPHVLKEIEKYPDNSIVEAAFLDPEKLFGKGELSLIVTIDEQRHHDQYFNHRTENEDNLEKFKVARMIQNYLITEAPKFNVNIIENNFDLKAI